jgi:hypothetical protein
VYVCLLQKLIDNHFHSLLFFLIRTNSISCSCFSLFISSSFFSPPPPIAPSGNVRVGNCLNLFTFGFLSSLAALISSLLLPYSRTSKMLVFLRKDYYRGIYPLSKAESITLRTVLGTRFHILMLAIYRPASSLKAPISLTIVSVSPYSDSLSLLKSISSEAALLLPVECGTVFLSPKGPVLAI